MHKSSAEPEPVNARSTNKRRLSSKAEFVIDIIFAGFI